MSYAANTTVSVDKTRAEIEGTLRRYGASTFHSGWNESSAFVAFKLHDRLVRLALPLPDKNEDRFRYQRTGQHTSKPRSDLAAAKVYEQDLRTRFRALLLCIKAKLESVESEIETFEQAFLAHIVLPDNSLVGERVQALVNDAYRTGSMKNLLPAPREEVIDADV